MPTLVIIEHSGQEHRLECPSGQSVMQAVINSGVPGVLADCGGACSCATCHGYVEAAWAERVPTATDAERDMIDCAIDVQDNSRLTCQIVMTPELDGLVVHLPKSQV
jgi:2Fe-2S ferredoxin